MGMEKGCLVALLQETELYVMHLSFQIRLPGRPDVVIAVPMCETYVYSMYETNDYVLMYETYAYSTRSYLDRT